MDNSIFEVLAIQDQSNLVAIRLTAEAMSACKEEMCGVILQRVTDEVSLLVRDKDQSTTWHVTDCNFNEDLPYSPYMIKAYIPKDRNWNKDNQAHYEFTLENDETITTPAIHQNALINISTQQSFQHFITYRAEGMERPHDTDTALEPVKKIAPAKITPLEKAITGREKGLHMLPEPLLQKPKEIYIGQREHEWNLSKTLRDDKHSIRFFC